MANIEAQFDKIGEAIYGAVGKLVKKDVDATLTRVQSAAINVQKKLFVYLASPSAGVINSKSAPQFSNIDLPQPNFRELTPDYAKRRARKQGLNTNKRQVDRFYLYTGFLKRYLTSIGNPLSVFGTPTIVYRRPGLFGSTAVYSSGKNGFDEKIFDYKGAKKSTFTPLATKLGVVQVDFYPKITRRDGEIKIGMKMGDYFTGAPKIAYRLDNYQGKHYREFMPQYLQWWVRVQGNAAVKGALR